MAGELRSWLELRLTDTATPYPITDLTTIFYSSLALLVTLIFLKFLQISTTTSKTQKVHSLRQQLVSNIAQNIADENKQASQPANSQNETTQLQEIQQLQKQIETLESENLEIEQQMKDLAKEKTTLNSEFQSLQIKLSQTEKIELEQNMTNETLEKEIGSLNLEIKSANQQQNTMRELVIQEEKSKKKLGQEIRQLESQIQSEEKRLEALETQLAEEVEKTKNLEASITEKNTTLTQQQAQLDQTNTHFDAIKTAYYKLDGLDDKESKLTALIDKSEITKELVETKTKLTALESNHAAQKNSLQELNKKNITLNDSLKSAVGEKAKVETELLQIKTRSKVIADFYTDRDLKFHTRLGVETHSRVLSEQDLDELSNKENSVNTQLAEQISQNAELKRRLDQLDRQHRDKINALQKETHISWLAAKDAEIELDAKIREVEALKASRAGLDEELVHYRNAAGLGAPGDRPPTMPSPYEFLDDQFGDLNMAGAPKPPTPPPGYFQEQFMHPGQTSSPHFGLNPMNITGPAMQPSPHLQQSPHMVNPQVPHMMVNQQFSGYPQVNPTMTQVFQQYNPQQAQQEQRQPGGYYQQTSHR